MHSKAFVLVMCAIGLLIVGAPSPATAEGEPDGSFPSWEERWTHQLINRARCDPQADLASCLHCPDKVCYEPTSPLAWSSALNRCARFHGAEMVLQGYFGHVSICTVVSNIAAIYPDLCDGSASCACVGGTPVCAPMCTTSSQRVALFGAAYKGQIIVSAGDPQTAFYAWLHESTSSSACHFNPENGHRWLTLKTMGAVGIGQEQSYYTVDFGLGPMPGRVPSGSHYPRHAATVELWANWYDLAGPSAAAANVDGVCSTMDLARGSAENGAWKATVNGVGSGCHRYYFEFRDALGDVVHYPTEGSLGIGPSQSCPDWEASRPQPCLVFGDGFETAALDLWSRLVP